MAYLATPLRETFRIYRDGKIISSRGLPPGRYHVRVLKLQVDYKGRLQHHWEIIPYDPLELSHEG